MSTRRTTGRRPDRRPRPTLAGIAVLGLAVAAAPAGAQTIAITGGTVYPVSGPKVERGTVVITNGRITAVGANVGIPAGAEVIDATGKWVTPGLIHSATQAGTGVAGLFGFGEARKEGDVTPAFNPLYGIDPQAFRIPIARTGGITTGIVNPGGRFLAGQSVAIDLAGDNVDSMIVKTPAALVVDLTDDSKAAGGGSRAGVIERLRQLFDDAKEYDRRRADFRRAAIQGLSAPAAELEALLPALRGAEPVLMVANRRLDIENALRVARDYQLKMILGSGVEAWQVADELAKAKVPVVMEPNTDIPSFDGLRARLDNATLLRQAGVKVVIAQGDAGGERNLRFAAGNAVRNGMSWDDALASITLWPAETFGLSDRYGSLQPGRVGNVVVWSGDPFEFSSVAEKVFIRGRETSLHTRENELRDRYRTLPPPR